MYIRHKLKKLNGPPPVYWVVEQRYHSVIVSINMTSRQIIKNSTTNDVNRVLTNNTNARYIGVINDCPVVINRAKVGNKSVTIKQARVVVEQYKAKMATCNRLQQKVINLRIAEARKKGEKTVTITLCDETIEVNLDDI